MELKQCGSAGLKLSPVGLGCMGLTAFYGPPTPDEDAVKLMKAVYDRGCVHFDTAEMYRSSFDFPSPPDTKFNEALVGKFLKTVPREKVIVATKYAPPFYPVHNEESVRKAVEGSLERLGTDYIDLYYMHRMPNTLDELKSWMQGAAKMVKEGKIRYVGLSEVGPKWLRIANEIHPVSAIQQEWSLLTRNLEDTLVPVCRELGVGIVAYAPLSRNLLASPSESTPQDWRTTVPRFSEENLKKNQELFAKIEAIAKGKGPNVTPSQLSLAWLYMRAEKLGVNVFPIPGTTKIAHAMVNIDASLLKLSEEEFDLLTKLGQSVAGLRGNQDYLNSTIENRE